MGNPERDWGLPSYPTAPNKKTVRDQGGSGKASMQVLTVAVAMVVAPMAVLVGLVVYLVTGNMTN